MENKMNALVVFFITAIVSIVLLIALANNTQQLSAIETVTDDTFTPINNSCVEITPGCIVSFTSIRNESQAVGVGNFTVCKSTGSSVYDGLKMVGSTGIMDTNNYNATYVFSGSCNYVPNATSRSLSQLFPLLFVIGILIAAVFYLRKIGLFDMF